MKTTTSNPDPDDDPNDSDKDANPTPPEPQKPEGADGWPNLVAEFYESKYANKSRGFLTLYAAHVVFIARMTRSSRLTAEFLSQKFGRKFSRRPVEDILKKVSRGEIVITRDELADVAKEHPTAQRYAELNPEILDPGKPAKKTGAKKAAKKTAAKKTAAKKTAAKKTATKKAAQKVAKKAAKKSTKKAAKASKPAAKKTTTNKSRKTPRSGPDQDPELPGFGQ